MIGGAGWSLSREVWIERRILLVECLTEFVLIGGQGAHKALNELLLLRSGEMPQSW